LQQQLDSAKADAAKQASKLAQAEMRASLIRQQLQEAQYQLRQLEEGSEQQPRADQLQESLEKAHSELNMLQGRLSPTEGQVCLLQESACAIELLTVSLYKCCQLIALQAGHAPFLSLMP